MTYPRTLHLTEDGTPIVVQRPTARAVATAARAAVGDMTMNDANELDAWIHPSDGGLLVVVVLADWIAGTIGLNDTATAEARRLAGRKGVPRG